MSIRLALPGARNARADAAGDRGLPEPTGPPTRNSPRSPFVITTTRGLQLGGEMVILMSHNAVNGRHQGWH